MASGAGKAAAQPPGPGSTVNGTAADFQNIEQELYDYQMHSKMCKKIAQLTKVRPAGDTERGKRAAGRADERTHALSLSVWGWLDDLMAAARCYHIVTWWERDL